MPKEFCVSSATREAILEALGLPLDTVYHGGKGVLTTRQGERKFEAVVFLPKEIIVLYSRVDFSLKTTRIEENVHIYLDVYAIKLDDPPYATRLERDALG